MPVLHQPPFKNLKFKISSKQKPPKSWKFPLYCLCLCDKTASVCIHASMSFFKTAQYCAFDGKIVFDLKNFPKKLVVTMTVANTEFKKVVLNQPRPIYKLSSFQKPTSQFPESFLHVTSLRNSKSAPTPPQKAVFYIRQTSNCYSTCLPLHRLTASHQNFNSIDTEGALKYDFMAMYISLTCIHLEDMYSLYIELSDRTSSVFMCTCM